MCVCPMSARFALRFLLVGAVLCLGLTQAHAQEAAAPDQKERAAQDRAEALRLYKIGLLQYEGQEYAKAADTFAQAFKLDPNEILAYNAGRSYERNGQLEIARKFYSVQLELAAEGDLAQRAQLGLKRIEEAQQAQAQREAAAKRLVGFLDLNTDAGSEVYIDGELAGSAPGRFEVEPGSHRLELRRPGAVTDRRDVLVEQGQTVALTILLEPVAAPQRTLGWSGMGLMGGGVLLGSVALGMNDPNKESVAVTGLGVSAVAMEAAGLGLLLWSLFDDEEPAQDPQKPTPLETP